MAIVENKQHTNANTLTAKSLKVTIWPYDQPVPLVLSK